MPVSITTAKGRRRGVMADKTAPKQRGKPFKPGESGNPKGRPQGSRNRATLAVQALIDGKADALAEKAIELALAGDGPVLRAMLDRLCPPRKDSPVMLTLPPVKNASDLPKITGAILRAVGRGELTPDEGERLAAIVDKHAKALELADIEARLAALEQAQPQR